MGKGTAPGKCARRIPIKKRTRFLLERAWYGNCVKKWPRRLTSLETNPYSEKKVSTQSSILVGCTNKVVWIRVEGKGSFLNSSGLKEFSREMINRGHHDFVVDLRRCPVMDSTFMGTLAGIALRLREIGHGSLRVTNLNERNNDLLCNLGLDQLFVIGDDRAAAAQQAEGTMEDASVIPIDQTLQAQTMLDAHEALVEAAPENLTKFKDVLEYLKQDLGQGGD